jgi:hypothetical protein
MIKIQRWYFFKIGGRGPVTPHFFERVIGSYIEKEERGLFDLNTYDLFKRRLSMFCLLVSVHKIMYMKFHRLI